MPELDSRAMGAVEHVRRFLKSQPRLGIILGSGLGSIADSIYDPLIIPYKDIPDFPVPTVEGHKGNLVSGMLGGLPVAAMQGRFHHYEGYHMRDISLQVRVLAGLGVDTLIVTNASGGISPSLTSGDIFAISDHINLMGGNPLVGLGQDGPGKDSFVDMTNAYDAGLLGIAREVYDSLGMIYREGVIAAVSGPCYETPAEVRMLGMLGADAVCMSTVPEVIMARYLGLRVLGLSLVTNMAAGLSRKGPDHAEVLDAAKEAHERFASIIVGVAERVAR